MIYAYGASYDPNTGSLNCPNAPNAAPNFFCPDGTYGVYDYRDPGELRIDREAEAILLGHVKTGAIAQDLTAELWPLRAACDSLAFTRNKALPPHRLRMALCTTMWARRTSISRLRPLI